MLYRKRGSLVMVEWIEADDPREILCTLRAPMRLADLLSGLPLTAENRADLFELCALCFRTEDFAVQWLRSPVPAYGEQTPLSLLERGQAGEVIGTLAGFISGTHI